jgi:hypothetical protein
MLHARASQTQVHGSSAWHVTCTAIFLASIWVMYEPRVRFLNTAFSTWLFYLTC